jgi:hypothetical protein
MYLKFDIDSDLPEDVFFVWQKDNPEMSFRGWIGLGRYVPTLIENYEFFDELDILTKDIEMKLSQLFPRADDVGDSDYDDDYDEEDDDGD